MQENQLMDAGNSVNSTNENDVILSKGLPKLASVINRKNTRTEKAPLISQRRLFRSLSGRSAFPHGYENRSLSSERTLGTFGGVFAPVALSQFSTILFLRIGFIIGSVGLIVGSGSLALAYIILLLTVFSICAISTNGAVEGGGAYFMISRTLGPEFGGAIGALFFFANIFSSALYSTGCVEGVLQNFGLEAGDLAIYRVLPEGPWCSFGYSSVLNVINLLVCLIGAGMFAKTTLAIFIIVLTCTASVIISFLAVNRVIEVPFPVDNKLHDNGTANYTGLSVSTLNSNLYPEYFQDYTTEVQVDYATVFGVLFSGVTGIMAGANMSGELKKPGKSIPSGTLIAMMFTFFMYHILFLLTASTTSRELLQNNYVFMMGVNVWPPFVTIGIITATLSASLSNMIGASRVLAAMVKDNIYGRALGWIGRVQVENNPVGAIVMSAVLVELVLLIGKLNTIARFTSVFFLMSYFATNLACLSLEWASAPNFRPTFQYFTWWTAFLGIIGNSVMMFVISAIASAVCIIVCLVLIIFLHIRSPAEQHNWGSISQALIFHQVRKYLLLLDSRKDHVKFWRPQILLLVANPRSSCPLIDFVNDLKKSGLYIVGHVQLGEFTVEAEDPASDEIPQWQSLIDHLKVKAFVEATVAPSVRIGLHHLARLSGLGAMKPNTVILGFSDGTPKQDFFVRETLPFCIQMTSPGDRPSRLRGTKGSSASSLLTWATGEKELLDHSEFVSMIGDVLQMGKNICLCRHFHLLDKESILRKKAGVGLYIDVWPINFFCPDASAVFDTSSLFEMQLATVLNMQSTWHKYTKLRVFLCIPSNSSEAESGGQTHQVLQLLHELRIQATINTVPWEHFPKEREESSHSASSHRHAEVDIRELSDTYILSANQLVRENSIDTAVTFLYLPRPPSNPEDNIVFLRALTLLTEHLHPTILVHGVSAVTTTNL